MLEATNLACVFDDRILFQNISFHLSPGDILLVEGENGAGKSTLLRILCGFRNADSGILTWRQQAIPSPDFYRHMSYVGHHEGIKKELTVLENLNLSLALCEPGTFTIEEALAKVGLIGYEDALAQTLSAGQKRRLALARLLITENRIWILDEPFTALDKSGIDTIKSLFSDFCSAGGIVVFTSHHATGTDELPMRTINLG